MSNDRNSSVTDDEEFDSSSNGSPTDVYSSSSDESGWNSDTSSDEEPMDSNGHDQYNGMSNLSQEYSGEKSGVYYSIWADSRTYQPWFGSVHYMGQRLISSTPIRYGNSRRGNGMKGAMCSMSRK